MTSASRRRFVAVSVAAFAVLFAALLTGAAGLPEVGDPGAPASVHVSPRYIERGLEETGALNMVTGVLADYRGYDTLGEAAVIFVAGLGCLLVLGAFPSRPAVGAEAASPAMSYRFGSEVLETATRLLIPWILLFAVYVLVHGHVSPGGGFQGGVLFGTGLIALRLVRGPQSVGPGGDEYGPGLRTALLMACAGILGYVGIGLACVAFGGAFLDYGVLPLGSEPAHVRELATLGIEAAVFVAVAGTVVVLFDSISAGIRE